MKKKSKMFSWREGDTLKEKIDRKYWHQPAPSATGIEVILHRKPRLMTPSEEKMKLRLSYSLAAKIQSMKKERNRKCLNQ